MKFCERLRRRKRSAPDSHTLPPPGPSTKPATHVSAVPTQPAASVSAVAPQPAPSNTGIDLGSSTSAPVTVTPTIGIEDYGDYERTLLRYRTAVETLKTAADATPSVGWGALDLSPLDAVGDLDGLDTIRGKIEDTLNVHRYRRDHPDRVGKLNAFVEKVFVTVTPFATNSSPWPRKHSRYIRAILSYPDRKIPILNPYGILCSGLILLMSVRTAEIRSPLTKDCRRGN
jgi:hypothetical protein